MGDYNKGNNLKPTIGKQALMPNKLTSYNPKKLPMTMGLEYIETNKNNSFLILYKFLQSQTIQIKNKDSHK